MLKAIKEVLRVGDATIKYPFAPIERPQDARGKPEHDAAVCMACGACAVACPANAIQMQVDTQAGTITWSINYGRCVYCGRCEEVCPTLAIALSQEFELAVMDKNDLEELAVYHLAACEACGSYYAPAKEVDFSRRILAQYVGEEDVDSALENLGLCPQCRQRLDAFRAEEVDPAQKGELV